MHQQEIEALGVKWPEPYEGRPFVDGEVTWHRPVQRVHYSPPAYPDLEIETDWEEVYDEGWEEYRRIPTAWRTLTDEEWAEALATYEKAKAEYYKTNGTWVVPGATTVEGVFFTCDGLTARGLYGKDKWFWTDVEWTET